MSDKGGKDLAVTADLHLILPAFIGSTFALGTADKPAEMSGLKFPGRAFLFQAAFFFLPAVFAFTGIFTPLVDQKKIHLALNVQWHGSPSLLVALDGFQRNTKERCKLFLGLVQSGPGF